MNLQELHQLLAPAGIFQFERVGGAGWNAGMIQHSNQHLQVVFVSDQQGGVLGSAVRLQQPD